MRNFIRACAIGIISGALAVGFVSPAAAKVDDNYTAADVDEFFDLLQETGNEYVKTVKGEPLLFETVVRKRSGGLVMRSSIYVSPSGETYMTRRMRDGEWYEDKCLPSRNGYSVCYSRTKSAPSWELKTMDSRSGYVWFDEFLAEGAEVPVAADWDFLASGMSDSYPDEEGGVRYAVNEDETGFAAIATYPHVTESFRIVFDGKNYKSVSRFSDKAGNYVSRTVGGPSSERVIDFPSSVNQYRYLGAGGEKLMRETVINSYLVAETLSNYVLSYGFYSRPDRLLFMYPGSDSGVKPDKVLGDVLPEGFHVKIAYYVRDKKDPRSAGVVTKNPYKADFFKMCAWDDRKPDRALIFDQANGGIGYSYGDSYKCEEVVKDNFPFTQGWNPKAAMPYTVDGGGF